MKKIVLPFLLMLVSFVSVAQSKEETELLAEATLLYNSERASWHGTDILMAKFPEKRNKIQGYFSYSEGNKHTCVFYDKENDPNVLATITFDDTFVEEAADVKSSSRKLTENEKVLYTIREKALDIVNKDTLFRWYDNANPNFIPLVTGDSKRVYVLSGPKEQGVIIFGNDYLIEFDKKNNIRSKKALHKNIMVMEYGKYNTVSGMHSHLESTGDLMTATDICTLMLYCPYTQWKNYTVMSKNKVSIWDCEKNKLVVMTREAWDKIGDDGKKE